MSNANEDQAHQEDSLTRPAWLQATVGDVQAVDIDAPLTGCTHADSDEIYELYCKAAADFGADKFADGPTGRVYSMLAAVMQMHFKPRERNEPFGPLYTSKDRRTAIPSDFLAQIDALATAAQSTGNPVLKARLADVCWLLDRNRKELGFIALDAYVEIVTKMEGRELTHHLSEKDGALHDESVGLLRRALCIGHALGRDKPGTIAARDAVRRLRKQSLMEGAPVEMLWFAELDLDFRVCDPAEVAADIDSVLAQDNPEKNIDIEIKLWEVAARAYTSVRAFADRDRCLIRAADVLERQAEAVAESAMLASHFLAQAISQLSGISGQRERRSALRQRLTDVQANVSEEMGSFEQEIDLTEITKAVRKRFGEYVLFDQLFSFAFLSNIPEPTEPRENAIQSIRDHPLSSFFPTSYLDREGKVIHRSQGGLLGGDNQEEMIRVKIAETEKLRRWHVAEGLIAAARDRMSAHHMIDIEKLMPLLQQSPFIPTHLVRTFATGFARFFQGDFISATYILTPLLENSLRHVLKSHGHDVTIFDDTKQTQQDRTISSLYEQMRPKLDAIFGVPITADIERVFLQQPGPKLRHGVAHGLLADEDPYGPDAVYGCWLIWRLCLAPLVPYREQLRRWLAGSAIVGNTDTATVDQSEVDPAVRTGDDGGMIHREDGIDS